MLALRFRPAWRTLSRSSYYQVQLQQRLGHFRGNASVPSVGLKAQEATKFDPSEPRLAIAFTCTADGCHHRSAHTFTKRAYERGIVLIQCPSCKNRHLIADNLGWFKDDTQDGRLRNIEDILRDRGEHVQRGTLNGDGVVEIPDS